MPGPGILETAIKAERRLFIQELIKLKVIRDSMLGDNWKVIYTEDGPMDITLDRLEGND